MLRWLHTASRRVTNDSWLEESAPLCACHTQILNQKTEKAKYRRIDLNYTAKMLKVSNLSRFPSSGLGYTMSHNYSIGLVKYKTIEYRAYKIIWRITHNVVLADLVYFIN